MALIELAIVKKPHGYKGECVVSTSSGHESALHYLKVIHIGETAEHSRPYHISEASWMPKGWKLRLEELSTDDQVKALRGHRIFAERTQLKDPEADQYYLSDLEGLSVYATEAKNRIGIFAGAQSLPVDGPDVWWIRKDDEEEFAVPATKRFIDKVDLANKSIWLKNLSDLA